MVLLSAHADCINMNFSYVSCVTTECTVKTQWCISLLLWAIWDSFDHLLSSNLWANNCHRHLVMTHFIDIIYCPPRSTSITAGCQKMWPLLSFIFTPLNEHSHSLNLFLLIEFYLFPLPLDPSSMEALVKSPMRELTLGRLWFPSKQRRASGSWVIEHYWF